MAVSQTYTATAQELSNDNSYSGSRVFYFTSSYDNEDQFTVDITGSTFIVNEGFSILPIQGSTLGDEKRFGAIVYMTDAVSASLDVTITKNNLPVSASSLIVVQNGGDSVTITDDAIFYNDVKQIDFINDTVNMTSSYVDTSNVKLSYYEVSSSGIINPDVRYVAMTSGNISCSLDFPINSPWEISITNNSNYPNYISSSYGNDIIYPDETFDYLYNGTTYLII